MGRKRDAGCGVGAGEVLVMETLRVLDAGEEYRRRERVLDARRAGLLATHTLC